MQDQDWWSLGFEATGPAHLLRAVLEATAGLVFAQALPGHVQPGPDECRSYAQWLGQHPGPGDNGEDCSVRRSSRGPAPWPGHVFRMLTARAITSAPRPSDTHASRIMSSLAQGLIAEVSVGLKAVAVQKASDR